MSITVTHSASNKQQNDGTLLPNFFHLNYYLILYLSLLLLLIIIIIFEHNLNNKI